MDYRKTDAEPVFQAAPLLNIENYLREYAYSMDPEINIPESEDKLRRYKEFQELINCRRKTYLRPNQVAHRF